MTYKECKSCSNRTEFICIRCGFCWSCHWKVEQIDKNELLATGQDEPIHLKNYILSVQPQEIKKNERHQRSVDQVGADITTNVIDVFGNEMEPICDYRQCHHKFSIHGLGKRICQCKHPHNSAVGA